VQLYIHDPVASISQPVRRLRGFQRVTLNPGQTRPVSFTLDASDFGFYDNSGKSSWSPERSRCTPATARRPRSSSRSP
jgi:beta-glucosidase